MLLNNIVVRMMSSNRAFCWYCQSYSLDVRQILRTLQCRLALSSSHSECLYTTVQQPTETCISHVTAVGDDCEDEARDESRDGEKADEYPA